MPSAKDRLHLTNCLLAAIRPSWRSRLQQWLVAWYAQHARDLPWRHTRDPYAIWISESMLQQTQVETVKPYFHRFMQQFPTVRDLADARESDVLRYWEGLGYYRRARQLHAAAKQVVDDFGGRFPSDVDALQSLPGIGRYTAGAVASIAFDLPAPILEANTSRLLSRLVGFRGDPTKSAGQRLLWQVATCVLPPDNIGRFNQAMMELGALVCGPTQPNCPACPVRRICAARAAEQVDSIPPPKRKKVYTSVYEVAVVVRKSGRILLRRCGDGERWAGLWDFPRFATDIAGPLFLRDHLVGRVYAETGIRSEPRGLITTMKHGVTRYRITLDCYEARFIAGRLRNRRDRPLKWVSLRQVAEYPLSATGRKLADLLVE